MLNKIYEFLKDFIKQCYKELIALIIFAILCFIEFPYVIYTPGGTINLDKRITISESNPSKGKINLTYVTLAKANIPNLLLSKILKDWDLDRKENITMDGDSVKETLEKDRYAMKESQDNAVLVAYKLAGKEVEITKYHHYVYYISLESNTTIKEFDEILTVDGQEVTSLDDMKTIVGSHKEGDILKIKVLRNKKEIVKTAKVFNTVDGLKIGIAIYTNIDYKADPDITIRSKNSESGPSGGAMSALAIYNMLTKEDITKGKIISGTGTIDKDGNIGEIGGVKYKLKGAIKAKSDIFICPKGNYKETLKIAKSNNYDIKIITGDTLEDIVNSLKNSL